MALLLRSSYGSKGDLESGPRCSTSDERPHHRVSLRVVYAKGCLQRDRSVIYVRSQAHGHTLSSTHYAARTSADIVQYLGRFFGRGTPLADAYVSRVALVKQRIKENIRLRRDIRDAWASVQAVTNLGPLPRFCNHCGQQEDAPEKPLLRCVRCKAAVYCSKVCQTTCVLYLRHPRGGSVTDVLTGDLGCRDWSVHKLTCKAPP